MKRLVPVFLTLLFLPLAGCLSQPAPSPSRPPIAWGLGLDVPQTLPEPGPFLEGAANVSALASALNATFPYVAEKCHPSEEELRSYRREVQTQNLLAAVDAILGWCEGPAWALSEKMAQDAIANGTEEQDYWRIQARANQTVAEAANYISRHLPPPGTVVDAEVQAYIMNRHTWYLLSFNGARRSIEGYRQDHNRLDLNTAFLNALIPMYGSEASQHFIARFPWSKGVCEAPDVKAYGGKLMAQVRHLLEQSFRLEPPSEGEPVNELYGALLKGSNITVPYYIQRGWWVGLVGEAGHLTLFQAILDTHATNRLPTREEAKYLLALHQRHNRTLVGENQMRYFESQLDTSLSWEEHHEAEARKALALGKMRSGFQDLHCTPIQQPGWPIPNNPSASKPAAA